MATGNPSKRGLRAVSVAHGNPALGLSSRHVRPKNLSFIALSRHRAKNNLWFTHPGRTSSSPTWQVNLCEEQVAWLPAAGIWYTTGTRLAVWNSVRLAQNLETYNLVMYVRPADMAVWVYWQVGGWLAGWLAGPCALSAQQLHFLC
jgi:hypothetical protein